MKINKYIYLYVVQGNYGYGWEDVDASESRKEALESLRSYCKNESHHAHRLIKRRELNPVFKES